MSSISWWHQALCLLFIEAICYSFLVSGRDKTWMKASWLKLSLDKMKVVYGFGKGKVFWVDKKSTSKVEGDSHCQNSQEIHCLLPHPEVPVANVWIYVFLARFYSQGAHWLSVDHSVLARHTKPIKALLHPCHYFQILSSLSTKMSSDKDSVLHDMPPDSLGNTKYLLIISWHLSYHNWTLLVLTFLRNIWKDFLDYPYLWSSVSHVAVKPHYFL